MHDPNRRTAILNLALYRLAANVLFGPMLLGRLLSGRDTFAEVKERLCISGPIKGGQIWLHAASIGEMVGATALMKELCETHDQKVILTVNTKTAKIRALGLGIQNLHVQLAPLDALGAPQRFLKRAKPSSYAFVENEIWPVRVAECAKRNMPIFWLAAKISERSSKASGFWAGIKKGAISKIARIWPMDETNQLHIRGFAGDGIVLDAFYNGKFVFDQPQTSSAEKEPALDNWTTTKMSVLFAASIHPGEADEILAGFKHAYTNNPNLRLIIAPRHVEKAGQFVEKISNTCLPFCQRSKGQSPTADNLVYLADTMHEMNKWYAAADVVVMGGTFMPLGGHSPIQAVLHDALVIHGSSVQNQREVFDLLTRAGVARFVPAHQLGAAIVEVFDLPDIEFRIRSAQTELNNLASASRKRTRDIAATIVQGT